MRRRLRHTIRAVFVAVSLVAPVLAVCASAPARISRPREKPALSLSKGGDPWIPAFAGMTLKRSLPAGAIHPSTSLRTVSLSNRESPLRWNGPPVAAALLVPPEEPAESASETRELIYKTVNFLILVGALGYFLRKPAAEYFASRSAAIRKGIEEGRKALAASEAELRVIEEKLSRLEQEIRAFEDAAGRDAAAEAERFRRETETEAAKLLEFARARLNSATRAARQELQAFAGAEALRLAELRVRERLDAPQRERLFARYLAGLKATELASRN